LLYGVAPKPSVSRCCVATMIGVYVPVPVEVCALAVWRRADGQPINIADVRHWFDGLAAHGCACRCWRCEAAAKADPDKVWRCLRDWRRTTAAARARATR
jgi:hypothetical protein